jgi:hypothetical protein
MAGVILIFKNTAGDEESRMVIPAEGRVFLPDGTSLLGSEIDPTTFAGTPVFTHAKRARVVDAALSDE